MPSSAARLAGIFIHPIKSCAALAVEDALVESRGLEHDRRWMLVDEDGQFVSGREVASLVRVTVSAGPHGLHVSGPGMETLTVHTPSVRARRAVEVWGSRVNAADAGEVAAEWFSAYAERPLRLVFADDYAERAVDPKYARPGDEVGFADGFPLLLLSQAALDHLSERVGRTMERARFRPNLLVDGVAAHAEDQWKRVRIGEVLFDVVKPCVRCVFTTVDPESGERSPDGEPLRTLKDYRRGERGVTFGQNLIPRGNGRVALGDRIEVIE